jgi:signal transduction histidine kinase
VNRRYPSRTTLAIAAAIVLVSIGALVALPLVMTARVERYRAQVESHAEPAHNAVNEIHHDLSLQISSLTRAAATRERRYVDAYRGVVASEQQAMQELLKHRGFLGQEYDARLADLQQEMNAWHAAVQQSIDSERLAFDANYPMVIEAVDKVDTAVRMYQASQRQEVRRLARIQLWMTTGLVALAAAAAAIVLWIISRLRALAVALAEESDATQAALDRERELVRTRDEILGIVSHDLRSPLTTIALSTQLLPGASEEEQAEHVDTIMATTRRMQRLIQDLLDVTTLENKRLSIKREMIDPAAVCREVIASHEPIAASKGIRLVSLVARELPPISGDRDRLAQALGNLIGNAFKFTPESGTVTLSANRRDGKIRFEVEDTGPGINPSDLPHLFEPFWQAKKTAHLGAGLGLKITRAIVEAHGGSIEVKNADGGGACFAFEVPAAG